jgi:hypothetical protein
MAGTKVQRLASLRQMQAQVERMLGGPDRDALRSRIDELRGAESALRKLKRAIRDAAER